MTITTKTRMVNGSQAEAWPIGIDLADVSVIHPDPDGGTMLFVRGDDWHWVEIEYSILLPMWKRAKFETGVLTASGGSC